MAAIIGSLRAELSASIAQFQSDMGAAADAVKKFATEAKAVGKEISDVGAQMSVALSLPLIALGRDAVKAAEEAADAQGQLQAAIKATGNTAGKTTDQLNESAEALSKISKFDKDDILRNVTTNLLTFGNIQGPVFDKAQTAIVNLAARMGGDLQGATVKVGRALNDPIKGMTALTRLGVSFTTQQQLQIKALVQSGQGLQAQGMILDALAAKYDGAAQAQLAASPSEQMQKAWHEFAETIGAELIPFLQDLADMLKTLLGWFDSLSPGMQKFVVYTLAIVAALGPVLVEVGTVIKLLSLLASGLAPVLKFMATLELATIGWVVGLAAVAIALVIFSKSVNDILHGDFTKAWEDAKDTASKIASQIKGVFATVPTGPTGKAGAGGSNDAQSKAPDFNQDNEALLKKTAEATKNFQTAITSMNTKISQGLGELTLPKATTQANALNAEIDAFVLKAKDAGVNTDKWSGQIATMRARIQDLKQAGLADEAKKFAQAVDQDQTAVDKFTKGAIPGLQEVLDGVDDQYQSLHDKITDQITAYAALADSNDAARGTMEKLQKSLAQLEAGHQAARDAAESQYNIENELAHLQAQRDKQDLQNNIQDLQQARGQGAPVSTAQSDLQQSTRKLQDELLEAESHYDELVKERQAIEISGTQKQKDDLDTNIALAKEYADLIGSTTAQQLEAQKKIGQAFTEFGDNVGNQLADLIVSWDGSLKDLMQTFRQLAEQLFVKPITEQIGTGISGGIKDLFSATAGSAGGGNGAGGISSFFSSIGDMFGGMFAGGGSLSPGEWGIAGENGPEPIFGGSTGLTVVSNRDLDRNKGAGGTTQVFNISTPDANSFRASRRQIMRQAKQGLAAA